MSTVILDNLSEIKKLDSANMLGSLEKLGAQVVEVEQRVSSVKLPKKYLNYQNLVIAGMGGSALGPHIIKSVFSSEIKVPFEIINGYKLPQYVGKQTLVLVSSYSGTTEEAVSALEDARARGAKTVVVTSGGMLAALANKYHLPALVFTTHNNPCGSPRMGLGYMIFGQIALLSKLGLIKFSHPQLKKILETIKKYQGYFGADAITEKNPAKQLAVKLSDKTVWYLGAEHLVGSAHAAANQMNENAKRFGGHFPVPEMNHHLMEGLAWPRSNQSNLAFVLLESDLYDRKVQKRFAVTQEVLEKNQVTKLSYRCQEKNTLAQTVEVLILLSYVSYYSAILEGIDPTAIPFVDYFKAKLK